MLVKICGLTNLSDAMDAQSLGADLLGFVFAENSKRSMTIESVSNITNKLNASAKPVALFQNQSIQTIIETTRAAAISIVQLHGEETPEFINSLLQQAPNLQIIKAFRVIGPETIENLHAFFTAIKSQPQILAFLLDSPSGGGTGTSFDWIKTGQRLDTVRGILPKIFLAGGLTHENVSHAIQIIRPDGVDVSSGVEKSVGKKDYNIMNLFISNAKREM
jgi:phosphoribosylanthranilate isomerase